MSRAAGMACASNYHMKAIMKRLSTFPETDVPVEMEGNYDGARVLFARPVDGQTWSTVQNRYRGEDSSKSSRVCVVVGRYVVGTINLGE